MPRSAPMIARRGISLALLFLLVGVLSADLSHFRTGGNAGDTSIFQNQRFHVGDGPTAVTDIFLSCNGLVFTAANDANIILPPAANFEFNTTPPTIGGSDPSFVIFTSFPDAGPIEKTFHLETQDGVVGRNFLVQNLLVQGFTAPTAPFQPELGLAVVTPLDSAWWMVANNPSASLPGGTAVLTPGDTQAPLGQIIVQESNVSPVGGAPFNGALWSTTELRITIPAGIGVTWDTGASVTNNLPTRVNTTITPVDYSENGGRTARINVTSDFAQNEAVTLTGLRFNVSPSATDQFFNLSIRCGGASNNTAHATVVSACQIQGLPRITASTGTSLFWVGDPPSGSQSFTITESAGSPKITTGGDLRLNIPASFDMTWDSTLPAPTASITAGAGTIAGTCFIENGGKTLRVDVTNNLVAGQAITISGARFANFTAQEAANGFVELEVGAIAGPEAVDTRGIRISQPTISSANDHIFLVNQGATTTSNTITLTEDGTNSRIINGTQIRLRMAGVNVVFAGTNPTLGGNLSGATVAFEDPAGGGTFSTMRLTSTVGWTPGSTGSISSIPVVANSPADVGNFQLFMSSSGSATATSTDNALLVLGDLPTMSSGTPQSFTVNDSATVANTITISASVDASPLFQNGNSLEIVIPAALNMEWANVQPTLISGSAAADCAAAVTFPNAKTLRLLINNPWSGAETLTLQGLQFTNFSAASAPPGTSLQLRVRIGGPFAATDSQAKSIGLPTIVSDANQVFGVNDPVTTMSPITITEDANTPRIRLGTDIRIRIPVGFNMTWNAVPTAVPGTGTGTVGTPVLDTAQILRIPVTANFSVGQTLRLTGGTFAFNALTSGLDNLELLVNGTTNVVPNAFDTSTIKVGTRPTVTSVFTGDANGGTANGSIDRLILTFSENINASSLSATTGLGFNVSGYNISLAGVGPANVLTLSLAETGQADTNGTPAVTYDPVAGDLVDINDTLELTAAPAATQDGSSPVIVSLSKVDSNGNGFLDQVKFTFSEAIGGTPDIARWILVDADGTTNLLQGLTSSAFSIAGNVLTVTLSDTAGTTGTPRFQYNSSVLILAPVLTDLAGTPNAVPTLTNNTLPVANAGADLSVIPSVVTLNGSASFDPDGAQALTFSWTEVSRPAGAPAIVFTNGGSNVASFIPRTAGQYVVRLRVTDLIGSSTDDATITVLDVPPVSDPVFARTTLTAPATNTFLRGVLSTDVNGVLTFLAPNAPTWAVVSQPAGSSVTLVDPAAEFFAGFVGPGITVPGVYELSFVARDTAGNASAPTNVRITANTGLIVPVAEAGPDIVVPVGTPATLDAGLSWSPSAPTFTWTRPDTTTATGQTLSFTPPGAGLYTFKLTVTAAGVVSAPDTVTVMAYNPSNRPPVAFASKLSPAGIPIVGETIKLDSAGSIDPENGTLSFAWSQVTGPTTALSNPAAAQPTFAPAIAGVYEFQLVVFDGTQLSFPSTVIIQVLPNGTVTPVSVSGTPSGTAASAGHFLSGNPVTLTSVRTGAVVNTWWEQMAGPTVVLTHDISVNPATFTPTVAGNYTFRVTALDFGNNIRVSSLTHVQIDAPANQSPNANAGSNQTGIPANTVVTLDGTASADDAAVTNYFWAQVAGPPVDLSSPYAVSPTFTPKTGATYVFQLTVTDGTASSAPSFVSVTVDPAPTTTLTGGGGGGGGCGLTFEPLLILALAALVRRGRRS